MYLKNCAYVKNRPEKCLQKNIFIFMKAHLMHVKWKYGGLGVETFSTINDFDV